MALSMFLRSISWQQILRMVVLSAGLLFTPGAAQATATASVVAWGCFRGDDGQCTVPPTAGSGVAAIAAGAFHSLALTTDGSVVAWGCGSDRDAGQCTAPLRWQAASQR